MMQVHGGATDVTTYFVLRSSTDGTELTGATITNIDLQYVRSGVAPAAKVDATALAATDSAHADNKAIEIDATDAPGLYRVDWPDAAFAAGVKEVILSVKYTGAFTEHLRVMIDPPVNVEMWNATDVPSEHTAGYPIVTVKDGTGTGEIDTASGKVLLANGVHGGAAATLQLSTVAVDGTTTLSGAVSLGSTLGITGTTTLAAVTTTGTVTFNAFTVSGATTLTGAVTAADTTNGSLGAILADLEDGGRLDLLVDSILTDTNELQTDWANGGRLDLLLDAALADTNELQTDWTNGGRLDLIVDAILVDTAEIGVAGAGLTDLGGMSTTMKAQVEAEVDDALGGGTGTALTAIPWNANWDTEVQSEVEDALVSHHVVLVKTTIATLASQTSFTLTAGSADNDAYNDCVIVIEDSATAAQKAVGVVDDYTGATKTVTLRTDPAVFTMATTDVVTILACRSLKPTVMNRTLDVSSTGESGVDWANVGGQSTAVTLSNTSVASVGSVTNDINGNLVGNVGGNVNGNVVGSVGSLATQAKADVNAEVDTALSDIRLDELLSADSDIDGAAPPTVGSVFHELMSATAGSFTFDQTTDSCEAIRNRGDSAWTTATGFSTHSAADVWTSGTRTLTAATNITSTGGTTVPQTGDSYARLGAPAGASVSADIAAIEAQTDDIGSAGAGLTAITGATLSSAYDFAKGNVAMTESYNADGAAATPIQALYVIMQMLTEMTISSTTMTIKKLDGSTTALTLTLNDATSPTSVTRAS